MIRLLIRYAQAISKVFIQQWDHFWFALGPTRDIGFARLALGVLATVYASSWLFDLSSWIASDGLLNGTVTRFLIGDQVAGTGSGSRVSLLYWFDSPSFVRLYLIITLLCSLAMAIGVGGRVMAAIVCGLILGIVHRVPMMQGAGDLLFTGLLGYLVIDPGKVQRRWQIGLHDRTERWSANLAVRLMQTHFMIWLLISLVSHLAEPMWWAGSAAWWLVSAQRSPWYYAQFLSDKPYVVNLLSHVFLLLHFLTILLLLVRHGRSFAIVTAGLTAIGIWGLSGDWFYGLAFILCTASFWGIASREFCELVIDEAPIDTITLDEMTTVVSSSKSAPKVATRKKHGLAR